MRAGFRRGVGRLAISHRRSCISWRGSAVSACGNFTELCVFDGDDNVLT